jgi:uncharacterized protein (DUF362 family)
MADIKTPPIAAADPGADPEARKDRRRFSRREFLACAAAGIALPVGAKLAWDHEEALLRADVFVAKAASYGGDLAGTIREGLTGLGLGRSSVRGKSVLLKPNLVEPSREAPHINTHPAVVRAAAEVFLRWDAREVVVAEGQGHCRDMGWVLDESGMAPVLDEAGLPFVDLNHDEVYSVPNRLRYTRLRELHLPATLRRADLIVSMPKLKTHHWAGVTLSMKNLFGVMPGICYGWPKNVLHHQGIPQSILDINAAVAPHLAIVDGIVGMEGDGPIMGTPRRLGALILGTNLPAVDATAARLMGIDPSRIDYLAAASGRLGPIAERHIRQRGEAIAPLAQRFTMLDHPSLSRLQGSWRGA